MWMVLVIIHLFYEHFTAETVIVTDALLNRSTFCGGTEPRA